MFIEIWQASSPFIVFFVGIFIAIVISRKFNVKDRRSLLLYCWHTIFTFAYYFYTLKYGADATIYYQQGLIGNYIFQPGTHFIRFIVMILTNYAFLNMLGCFLIFNIIGSLGLIILDSTLQPLVHNQKKSLRIISFLVIFLPSMSFWSSGIGKDPISFLAVTLTLWAVLNLKKRLIAIIIAILMMVLVRPHIAGIMILALTISSLFDKKNSIIMRIILMLLALGISTFLVPYALNYAGINESNSPEDIAEYIQGREDVYKNTDSGVTLSEMSFPMKLFTYMFRPMVFEARSITQIFAALDNLILLYLFIFGGYKVIKTKRLTSLENRKFMWVYALTAWIILALTTGNLGIAVRQKIMVLPFFLYLFISVMSKDEKFSDYYK